MKLKHPFTYIGLSVAALGFLTGTVTMSDAEQPVEQPTEVVPTFYDSKVQLDNGLNQTTTSIFCIDDVQVLTYSQASNNLAITQWPYPTDKKCNGFNFSSKTGKRIPIPE